MLARKETFKLAIQNEIMSQNLYLMLSRSFKSNFEISEAFKNLIPLEQIHEEKLRAAYEKEFPGSTLEVDLKLTHKIKPEDITDPIKVLDFAITREIIAFESYTKMAKESTDKELIKLLEELATEENYHKTILETEILRIDGLMTWYDSSELNGLVEY